MYAAGGFNFPTSTGAFAVTGLGFKPVAVILMGGNKATVGSLMTGLTGPGLFISMNAQDYTTPTNVRSFGLSPNGNSDAGNANYRGIETGPISMQTDAATASVVDYKASAITFDSDGFTLTVATAASGVRPIHWWAFGGDISTDDPTAMISRFVEQNMSGSPTFTNAFEPLSALVLSTIGTAGFGEGNVDNNTWFSWGTAHYPAYGGSDSDTWQGSTVYTELQLFSGLGRQGFTNMIVWPSLGGSNPDDENISNVISSVGPVLVEGYRRHRPYVEVDRTTMINVGGGASALQAAMWSNGEGWTDAVTVPAGGSVTVNHPVNFEEFEVVMFSLMNGPGWSGGASTTAPMRFGVGVLHTDHQGCVVFGQDGSFYQSNTECVASCAAGGYSAASGTMNGSSFTLTSTNAALGDFDLVWHAFGRAKPPAQWIPHIYRMVRSFHTTRGVAPIVLHGFLLLEDGDKIILEDGSGFLKLG